VERLRYYIGYSGGLMVVDAGGNSQNAAGTFFNGTTPDHLTGRTDKPEVVFAAIVKDGGYRTLDGGKTWHKLMDGDVRTFSVDPHNQDVIYMGVGPVRLYRSEDGGTTWEPLDGILDLPAEIQKKWELAPAFGSYKSHVRHVFIHPDDQNFLFVLLEHGGVLLSRDRGATWEDRSNGIDYVDMHCIGNVPGSKETFLVSSARGFYRTDDCGKTWVRSETGMPWTGTPNLCYSHEWRMIPGQTPRLVLCGGRGSPGVWMTEKVDPKGHILLSDDAGAHWRLAGGGIGPASPMMPWVLVPHPSEARSLFCGMGTGSRGFGYNPDVPGSGAWYRSQDAGESWDPLMPELPSVITAWVAPA
jgi:hypothetical protein